MQGSTPCSTNSGLKSGASTPLGAVEAFEDVEHDFLVGVGEGWLAGVRFSGFWGGRSEQGGELLESLEVPFDGQVDQVKDGGLELGDQLAAAVSGDKYPSFQCFTEGSSEVEAA